MVFDLSTTAVVARARIRQTTNERKPSRLKSFYKRTLMRSRVAVKACPDWCYLRAVTLNAFILHKCLRSGDLRLTYRRDGERLRNWRNPTVGQLWGGSSASRRAVPANVCKSRCSSLCFAWRELAIFKTPGRRRCRNGCRRIPSRKRKIFGDEGLRLIRWRSVIRDPAHFGCAQPKCQRARSSAAARAEATRVSHGHGVNGFPLAERKGYGRQFGRARPNCLRPVRHRRHAPRRHAPRRHACRMGAE